MSEEEEAKGEIPTSKENAQTTLETGTNQEQNTLQNTITTSGNKQKRNKKKPSEIRVDSKNSEEETKNKFKTVLSAQSLK